MVEDKRVKFEPSHKPAFLEDEWVPKGESVTLHIEVPVYVLEGILKYKNIEETLAECIERILFEYEIMSNTKME